MKSKKVLFTVTILLVSSVFAYANPDATISYAEGSGFILVSDNIRTAYDIASDEVIGMMLNAGDTLLTDDGAFLEIELLRGNGGVVKLAENTTLTVMSLDESGGGVFRVAYGRIRVKVASLLGSSRVWVTGHDTVAGVRGTDFGYDMFYDQAIEGGERQTAVYVFDGEVDVIRYDKENTSKIDLMGKEPLILGSGKMVKTRSSDPGEKLRVSGIDDEIINYWNAYPILTALGVPALIEEPLPLSDDLKLEEGSQRSDYEVGGKILFVTGVGLMTAGGLVRVFLPDNSRATSFSAGLIGIGAVSIATGGGMIVHSINLK